MSCQRASYQALTRPIQFQWRPRWTGLGAGVLLLSIVTMAHAQQQAEWFFRQVQDQRPAAPADFRPSQYWLGLECYPADAALRAQLGIEKMGLVVGQVVPESPGEKAGIQKHDVLIKAGDEALADVPQLVKAIESAKDGKLSLELLRAGKAMTVEVEPEKRPRQHAGPPQLPEDDMSEFRRWVDSLRAGERPGGPFRYRFFGPGAVLPSPGDQKLPKDLTITITRSGEEPAQVKVTKGDKTWEVAEGDLSELPEDVRPHVERMLGRRHGLPQAGDFEPGFPPALRPAPREDDAAEPNEAGRLEKRLEREMKQLNEQLERLQKRFEDMQKSLPKRDVEQPERA